MVVMLLALAWTARSLITADVWTDEVPPEVKARFLAENMAGLMNVSVLGLPTGVAAGILLVWRRRVRR